jgi:hypothetical protein
MIGMNGLDKLIGVIVIVCMIVSIAITYSIDQNDNNQPIVMVEGKVVDKPFQPGSSYLSRQGEIHNGPRYFVEVDFDEKNTATLEVSPDTYNTTKIGQPCTISLQRVSWGIYVRNSSIKAYYLPR